MSVALVTIGIVGAVVAAIVFTLYLKKATKNLDKEHREALLTDNLKFGITLTVSGVSGLLVLLLFGK